MRLAIAVAVAVALAGTSAWSFVAHAQSSRVTVPDTAADAIAEPPAVKRLKELVAVVNSGDIAAMKVYIETHSVQAASPPGPLLLGPGAPLAVRVLEIHRYNSGGLELVRVATLEDSGALAVVRNTLTGHEQAVSVKIEPQAPHRITGLPWVRGDVEAPLVRPAAPAGESEHAHLQHIGAYLKRLADADVFSGVVMVARDGKPVFSRAHGYANREKKAPSRVSESGPLWIPVRDASPSARQSGALPRVRS